MPHERFHYNTLDDVRSTAAEHDVWFPLADDMTCLAEPLAIGRQIIRNRIAIQPMEGSDGQLDGTPDDLTYRRYQRFTQGGAGLIWFEAVATLHKGRASAHQLMLTDNNIDAFQRMTEMIRETGLRENGFAPMIIMQATHSGRYAKPDGKPMPQIAYTNPYLEDSPLDASCILSDDEIQTIEESFGRTARLAQRAGFDGIDIKACHRYLASELLSAYIREGRYGGSFENRTRFLMNLYQIVKASVTTEFIVTSRMNVYDGFPYPYGFGVSEGGGLTPNIEEAKRLIGMLLDTFEIPMINVTIGNPYKNPHVNRPYDQGNYVPDEHPLVGISRMMRCVRDIQAAYPMLPVIGSAFSYLRQFSGNLAAGMIQGKYTAMAGFGRLAFAYPGFANDLFQKGMLDRHHVCITCGKCALLLRAGGPSGCAVRDVKYQAQGGQA